MKQVLFPAVVVACIFAVQATHVATAQTYPSRPITMVVPLGAGGSGDILGRTIAAGMQTRLGQPVVVENMGGASGSLAAGRVARAPGDGYTLILGNWSSQVVNGAVYSLRYDLVKDFEPVAMVARQPVVIAGKKSLPANNLKELLAWLKANPDKALQGSNGPGSVMHLAGVLFQKETGTRFVFVPYRGSAATMQALVSGEIDFYIGLAADVVPQVRAGAVKGYAVASDSRLATAPEIPTADEAGAPGFRVSAWNTVFASKDTPKDVIAKLNSSVVDTLADPAVKKRLSELGWEIPRREQQTPQWLGEFRNAEIEKWWPLIKAEGIKAE